MAVQPTISIIIPVYNEQNIINNCIKNLKSDPSRIYEIIVIDGVPEGSTISCIIDKDIKTLLGVTGRAAQMNLGATTATGEILIFLHADTKLPEKFAQHIIEALNAPGAAAGAFNLSFDDTSLMARLIAFMANIRTHIERVPYGDQAPFVFKKTFEKLGGFPLIPIMEDVEFFRKIKKLRLDIVIVPAPVTTSARRFKQIGMTKGFLRNWLLRILHLCGVNPFVLQKMYRNFGDKN